MDFEAASDVLQAQSSSSSSSSSSTSSMDEGGIAAARILAFKAKVCFLVVIFITYLGILNDSFSK